MHTLLMNLRYQRGRKQLHLINDKLFLVVDLVVALVDEFLGVLNVRLLLSHLAQQ